MTAVDDAIAEVWKVALGETAPTPQFARRVEAAVTAEITRLNELNIQVMLELRAVHDRLDVERKEHREEMRDAGRDYREMESEINALQREREGW